MFECILGPFFTIVHCDLDDENGEGSFFIGKAPAVEYIWRCAINREREPTRS